MQNRRAVHYFVRRRFAGQLSAGLTQALISSLEGEARRIG